MAFETLVFAAFRVDSGSKTFSAQDGVLFNVNKSVLTAYPVSAEVHFSTVPSDTETMGTFAFADAFNLQSVFFPSVRTVEDYALTGSVVTNVTFGEGLLRLRVSVFQGCTGLATVQLPGTLQSIGESSFENCKNLTAITLPGGVRQIGGKAFLDSGL
jgi:hypothetical protein